MKSFRLQESKPRNLMMLLIMMGAVLVWGVLSSELGSVMWQQYLSALIAVGFCLYLVRQNNKKE